jgi:hypothetical protein
MREAKRGQRARLNGRLHVGAMTSSPAPRARLKGRFYPIIKMGPRYLICHFGSMQGDRLRNLRQGRLSVSRRLLKKHRPGLARQRSSSKM